MRKKQNHSFRSVLSVMLIFVLLFIVGCTSNKEEEKPTNMEGDKIASREEVSSKMSFWDEQRKGTNFMNSKSIPENYPAANEENIEFIRLAPDKWAKDSDYFFKDKPDSNPKKDFLIGNADQYEGLVEEDFAALKADLDAAQEQGSKVVLTVLSLPGNRWRQFNNRQNDDRIWQDYSYHEQSAQFWKDLATRLKDHPAVVGYNLVNEPHPETESGYNNFWDLDYSKWYSQVENTAADLNKLYETIVEAIRMVDKDTPIILNSGLYATPWAFEYLKPINDENVLYAFHMYEPYEMTSQNRRKGFEYEYPGKVKVGEQQTEKMFNKEALKDFLQPVDQWAKDHNIPANRIIAEEFGINRMVKGADQYLSDLISIFDEYGWHWAFYAFREDTWEGMDYQLGDQPPKWKYWEALEKGELPNREQVEVDNPLWGALKNGLEK